MRTPTSQRVDIAIITSSRDELEPVLNLLGGRERWEPFELHEFHHYSGQFTDGARSLNVVAGALWNVAGTTAAIEVSRLQALYPQLVVMTATCVGWQEHGIQLGDLLVADRAFSGGQGKLSEAGLQADIQTYQSPAALSLSGLRANRRRL